MNELATDLAARINKEHQACEQSMRSGLQHAVSAGLLLIEAKKALRHGGWLKWLEANCRFSSRLAQKYMQIAKAYPKLSQANAAHVADLTFRDALAVVAKTTSRVTALDPGERDAVLASAVRGSNDSAVRAIVLAKVKATVTPAVAVPPLVSSHEPLPWQADASLIAEAYADPQIAALKLRLNSIDAEMEELVNRHEELCAAAKALSVQIDSMVDKWTQRRWRAAQRPRGALVKAG